MTQRTVETSWASTVANAAPATPILNVVINRISRKIFSREEIHILRKAMAQYVEEESSEDNKWLHLQFVGVDDILKDGNFTMFFGYHRNCIKLEEIDKC